MLFNSAASLIRPSSVLERRPAYHKFVPTK